MQMINWKRYYIIAIALGCVAFAVPLISYIINGSFMRYSGDDYCYASALTRFGFWRAQLESYLNISTYNGDRYSLTLISGISGLFGPLANAVLPGSAIILWLIGMILALNALAKINHLNLSGVEILLLAEFLVFMTLYQAPNLPQILYWRSGMLPYLAPLIANVFLIWLVLVQLQREGLFPLSLGVLGVLAFLAGGFSETGAAFQAGIWVLFLTGTWFAKRREAASASRAIMIPMVALIGTALAVLLLFLSPTNQMRQANLPPLPNLVALLGMSLRFSTAFIYHSLLGLPLPILITFCFTLALSYTISLRSSSPTQINGRGFILSLLLISLVCFLLVIFCIIPSAYAQSAYPESRALITARYVMVIAVASAGWLAGQVFSRLNKRGNKTSLSFAMTWAILFFVMVLYPLHATTGIAVQTPKFHKWAVFWDVRDQEIRAAKQRGLYDVKVVQLDRIIPSVGELSPDPGHWYNVCAAGYYGINSISASLPGWDR